MSSNSSDLDVRVARVSRAIRDIVANAVVRGLRDVPRGPVTITRVDVSHDFKAARVHVGVFVADEIKGKEREDKIDRILFALEDAKNELRQEINKQIRIKNVPHLEFVLDTGARKSERIAGILKSVASPQAGTKDEEGKS